MDHYGENNPLPIRHLDQMLHFILKRNYFEFNNEFYLQTMGTAIGTSFAPNYANIFMSISESKMLTTAPEGLKPLFWIRYIDDIFSIWTHDINKLKNFYNHMNSIHETIKFEMSYSMERIAFLDTMTILKKDSISTTIYKKPTDICSLLHAQSFHPNNCKKGIIYSQALR